jgi:hypothetical protein
LSTPSTIIATTLATPDHSQVTVGGLATFAQR